MAAINRPEDLALLVKHLQLILSSGLSLDEGLALLAKDHPHTYLSALYDHYQRTRSLSESLTHIELPELVVASVELALRLGQSERILPRLTRYYERQADHQAQLKKLLQMPLALLIVLVLLLNGLSWWVLPLLKDLLVLLNQAELIWLSLLETLVQSVGLGLLIALGCALMWMGWATLRHHQDATQPDLYSRILNLFKHQQRLEDTAELMQRLSLMVHSGMTQAELDQGLLVQFPKRELYKQLIAHHDAMQREGVLELILKLKLVSALDQKTIQIAQQTGHLDEQLETLALRLQNQAEVAFEARLQKLEPWLMGGLIAMVSLILMVLLTPLFQALEVLG